MAATSAAISQPANTQAGVELMIRLEEVEKVYRTDRIETVALTNVNLAVRTGEFISIMGRRVRQAPCSTSSAARRAIGR
jgi:ABC-type polysaccharide/polyol phosphate transport system ATPase subunit